MAITIPVAHDFICPWCWIALSQAMRLKREFDVEFDWMGYELFPAELDWPEPAPPRASNPSRPLTPSRLDLALAAEGLAPFAVSRPYQMRSHNAHLAVEYAKTEGKGDELVRVLYDELFLRGTNINDPSFLEERARGIVNDVSAMRRSIDEGVYSDHVVPFDERAHASGVFNVPTFFIGGKRYAEQPYSVLREAIAEVAEPVPGFWRGLTLPASPENRPYTAIVMAQTVEGAVSIPNKSFIGTRDDLYAMRTLEQQFDASLVGAETVRRSPASWYSRSTQSFVLSRSGELLSDSEYVKRSTVLQPPNQGDLSYLSEQLRIRHNVKTLLIEGGPSINRQFLERGLVDELFLTIAPTISMQEQILTIIGQTKAKCPPISLKLISEHKWGDELFVRYRIARP